MASTSIYRGDSDSWTLSIPLTLWSAGGKFFFGLKAKGDLAAVDATDTSAVLKKTYDDTFITSTTATDKVYTLTLLPTDTAGTTPGKYIGEFQWVNSVGLTTPNSPSAVVKTFDQFKYQIKADLNQRTA